MAQEGLSAPVQRQRVFPFLICTGSPKHRKRLKGKIEQVPSFRLEELLDALWSETYVQPQVLYRARQGTASSGLKRDVATTHHLFRQEHEVRPLSCHRTGARRRRRSAQPP